MGLCQKKMDHGVKGPGDCEGSRGCGTDHGAFVEGDGRPAVEHGRAVTGTGVDLWKVDVRGVGSAVPSCDGDQPSNLE